ncbi:MAG TPA: gamma-glutamyltransferase [Acidisphaera sp.]|nr:gamma-glutamyltransferase [Acidisphaera sp.]
MPLVSRTARARLARGACAALLLATGGCDTINSLTKPIFGGAPPVGQVGHVTGFLGGVVADEPRAALVGRTVLSEGANAADAATAVGFALAVTLPSRAGLGGGGACLAYSPGKDSINGGVPEAIVFVPPASEAAGGDRPAALPTLARGLFALQARYGRRPFDAMVTPAEQLARFGVQASRALVRDLDVVARPLMADPNAAAVFAPGGQMLTEGARLIQPDLGATLAQLRVAGVGDMYIGALARRVADGSRLAGGPITVDQLRTTLPRVLPPVTIPSGRDEISFLPPPADGGVAAAAAYQVLARTPSAAVEAEARSLAVLAQLRQAGGDPLAMLRAELPPAGGMGPFPASTTFATLDRDGNAVVCALTMNNLFGTGRMVPGMGFLLAASPARITPPMLAAALAWNEHIQGFRAETGGSGQEAAGLAAGFAMAATLQTNQPLPVPPPDPGRANVIACSRYLPDAKGSCGWATDPRGSGLAVGAE